MLEIAMRVYRSRLLLYLLFVILLFSGCNTGYRKVEGRWSYVTWDEAHGYTTKPLGADEATFNVLGNKQYAKDKNNVYYQGRPIDKADASTFVMIKGGPYSKDKNHVYLLDTIVINADPNTFTVINYPYARDKKGVYCGTVPVNVINIGEFEVIQPCKGYLWHQKDDFIRINPEYSYLKDYPVGGFIYCFGGKAKTKTEYFEGFKKI